MYSGARLSPRSHGVENIDTGAARLDAYENWGSPTLVDFEEIASVETWAQHSANWEHVQESMRNAQILANEIKQKVADVQTEL